MKSYMQLAIPPVQKHTYDPTIDFPQYMQNTILPQIKELEKTAQELINILRSKHIT